MTLTSFIKTEEPWPNPLIAQLNKYIDITVNDFPWLLVFVVVSLGRTWGDDERP